MRVTLNWLKDFVDINMSVKELEEKLVSCGFEVDEIIEERERLKNITTGEILEIKKHPDADKLQVCQIKVSEDKILQVITSAQNVFVGAKVPVVQDNGAIGDFKIVKGKMRGVLSEGMMCGGEELGLTEDDCKGASVNGILILDKDTKIGQDINDVFGFNDTILDIAITSNRADCNSVLGIAREIAAVTGQKIRFPELDYKIDEKRKIPFEIIREEKELCSRYIGCVVENTDNTKTPAFIRRRLRSLGNKSISPFVDITNYIRIEIGQPMHVFDISKLDSNKIIVRNAKKDEKILLLDKTEAILNDTNLVIADSKNALAIAGVMGGLLSGVTSDTKDILFESAAFKKENIRRTSRELNVRSDSSFRYERGIDNLSQEIGIKRALHFVSKYNLGTITNTYIDSFDGYKKQELLHVDIRDINKILGIEVDIKEASRILNSLDIKNTIKNTELVIDRPLFRDDIENANDVAEEVIRFIGYDKIESSLLTNAETTIGGLTDSQKRVRLLKTRLVERGFFESLTYSFTSPKMFDVLRLNEDSKLRNVITLGNPLGLDLSIMRTTLAYSMLQNMEYNYKRGNKNTKLFELSKVYSQNLNKDNATEVYTDAIKNNIKISSINVLPNEVYNLCVSSINQEDTFYVLKEIINNLIKIYNKNIRIERSKLEFLHPGKSIDIFVNDEYIGYMGEVHPEVLKTLDLPYAIIAEISVTKLDELYEDSYKFEEISKFPIVERDIAVVFDEDVTAKDIIEVIKEAGSKILKSAKIFDIFRSKEKLGDNKKSVAISLSFGSNDKTLEEKDIETKTAKILRVLESKLNGQLR